MSVKHVLVGAGVGVAVAAYVATSWGLGRAAHAQFDQFEQELAKQPVSLVKIAQREYTAGVFSSVETITLEINQDLWGTLTRPRPGSPGEFPGDEEVAFEKAMAQSLEEPSATPPRVTIRNEVLHGPLPGFTAFGAARIKTTLVLEEETRTELARILGEREPLVIDTLVGLTGAGRMHASSPPFEMKEGDARIAWQGIEGKFAYGRNVDSMTCDVLAPGAEGTTGKGTFTVGRIEMKCELHRAFGDVFSGTTTVDVASLRALDAQSAPSLNVESVGYKLDMRVDGEYVDMAMDLGAARIQVNQVDMRDVRYDLAVNHLHGPTYAAVMTKFREIGTPTDPAAAPDPMSAMEPLMTLFEHAPQLVIKRIGFSVPEGEVGITGTVQLKDFTKIDFQNPSAQLELIRKIDAAADVWFDEGVLARDWSNGSVQQAQDGEPSGAERLAAIRNQVAQLEQQGFLVRKDDRLQSRIEFKQGVLTANGKPLSRGP